MPELPRSTLSIDPELAFELRVFAVKKHGFLRGALRAETEKAIRQYLDGGG